jgi:hypothetical protein
MVSPGSASMKDRCGGAVARLLAESADWDLIDLEPLADPSRMRASLVARLAELGFTVESSPSAGGARKLALVGLDADATDAGAITVARDEAERRGAVSALRRLSRLEWAERDERSPLADQEATNLLEEIALRPGVRVIRLDEAAGEAVAVAIVVDDRERAVVVAMAVDPQAPAGGRGAPAARRGDRRRRAWHDVARGVLGRHRAPAAAAAGLAPQPGRRARLAPGCLGHGEPDRAHRPAGRQARGRQPGGRGLAGPRGLEPHPLGRRRPRSATTGCRCCAASCGPAASKLRRASPSTCSPRPSSTRSTSTRAPI